MTKKRGRIFSAKLPFTDPDALTLEQVKSRFGYSSYQLYQWAKQGIPSLGFRKLPCGMTPGLGPGKPSKRVWCGKTLKEAYESERATIPDGFESWKGILAKTGIPQSTLRALAAKGKIRWRTVPVPGLGRTLQKVYSVEDIFSNWKASPERLVDESGQVWITARAAEKNPTLKGINYRFLFRALGKGVFAGIGETPIVFRHPAFNRTYFCLDQLRRVAKSPYKEPEKVKPFVDSDGIWFTVNQSSQIVGLPVTQLTSFWDETPERCGKRLLELWSQNPNATFKKRQIPPVNQGAKKRYSTVRGFELESLRKLAAILNKPFCLDGFEIEKIANCHGVAKQSERWFPKGLPENTSLIKLAVLRNDQFDPKKKNGIALACEVTGEPIEDCPFARSLDKQLRAMKSNPRGKTYSGI